MRELVPTVNFKLKIKELNESGFGNYSLRRRKKATNVYHYYIRVELPSGEVTDINATRAKLYVVAKFPGQVYVTSSGPTGVTFRLLTKKQLASGEYDREMILG